MKKVLLSVAAVTFLFASCKKDDDGGSVNRKETLQSGKWKVSSGTIKSTVAGQTVTSDYFSFVDDCNKDDLTIFRADSHLITDAGTVKCSSTEPQQSDDGIWALTENDTKLVYTQGTDVQTNTIEQLDANTLRISNTYTQGSVSYSTNVTFTHVN